MISHDGFNGRAVIEMVHNAIVCPLVTLETAKSRGELGTFDGGVYFPDGRICDTGVQVKGRFRNVTAPLSIADVKTKMAGKHIFGGLLHGWHFGHFVTESIARLWAIRELEGDYESLVFYDRHLGRTPPNFAAAFIKSLGWHGPITIVAEPTQFELLAVPSQICDVPTGYANGHPMVRRLFDPLKSQPLDGPEKIYVSRSKLGHSKGGFFLEENIEANLIAEGYEIVHPQELSIAEQFRLYRSAKKIVAAEGSPVHLMSYACEPDQDIFVIWRRGVHSIYLRLMESFGGPDIKNPSCIDRLIYPNDGSDYLKARSVIDFAKLRDLLVNRGFISGERWSSPQGDMLEAMVEKALRPRGGMTFSQRAFR
ncbi:glycosyltransferase 61 family protein [Sphingobium sp. YR768]|uniref:glycosyltransferase 61 family protein n=1 Tax=Sphingobium sp. YR768 TaxID=1884365 RepID=UPI0008C78513|nr:glycosyltransferase 61 family protein [Sphingobium sp. YR768]SEQ53465.1 Protein of unknown function [Sphingobium sp. YR768]